MVSIFLYCSWSSLRWCKYNMTQDLNIKKAQVWLKTWSNLKIVDGKNFRELLTYKNTSLWWFIDSYLIYKIKYTLEKSAPYKGRKKVLNNSIVKFYLSCRYLLRALYGRRMLLERVKKKTGKAKILLITESVGWGSIYKGKKKKKGDRQFDEMMNALEKQGYEILAVEADVRSFLNLKTLREKRGHQRGLWVPFEVYLTLGTVRKALRESKKYKKIWQNISNNRKFKDSLTFEGRSFYDVFSEDLENFFGKEAFHVILYINMALRLLEREKPDLVLIVNEYGPHGRSAVIASKIMGIPSLALQHGIIHPFHHGYFHTSDEINKEWELSPMHCPIPDKTAVYGPFVHRVLKEECKYPEDMVAVTGQPRYDILAVPDKHFSREEFCSKFDLDPKKGIALITTQTLQERHREAFLRAALRALKELPDFQIVIKPHPGEDELWNKTIAQNEGVKATFVPKSSSVHEALYACDTMITVHSTTAIEAMILDKPVVVVNLTGQIDPMPYAQSGAALGVYREKELLPAIKNALYDENTKNQLKEARKRFVYEHAYKVDGKSTRRVVELIEEMMSRKPVT